MGQRDVWPALLLVQLRPHATVVAQMVPGLRERLMNGFAELGWESPQLSLNGGHLAMAGKVAEFGHLDNSPELHPYTADGELLFGGDVVLAPPGWLAIAERAGSVGVLVSADPLSISRPTAGR